MAECSDNDGNCTLGLDADGQLAQCLGEWSPEKHEILGRYIEATWGVRQMFLGPGKAGAAFIDLFAGPGRGRIRETGVFVDGSPLFALKHDKARFSRVVLCEKSPTNAEILRGRVQADPRAVIIEGDCNERIDEILNQVSSAGFNIALVDPYGLNVQFDTFAKIGLRTERTDLLIHVPLLAIQRNFWNDAFRQSLDLFLGTSSWRSEVNRPEHVSRFVGLLLKQLETLGYKGEDVSSFSIKNRSNRPLYALVGVSKNEKGSQIWNSIAKTGPSGQRELW